MDRELESNSAYDNRLMIGLLIAVLLVSAGVVFAATSNLVLTAAYAAGLAVLLAGAFIIEQMRSPSASEAEISTDWSVTVAAIEQDGSAVAITDRANRLVCANSAFVEAFGVGSAPPSLPLERPELEAMTRLAREAWRDGVGALDEFAANDGSLHWSVSVERAGRGEDHLIWRFRQILVEASEALEDLDLSGPFGQMLSRAGIETAITTADGVVRQVSAGFAERASGDATATLAGQDFVSVLRSDER
ncbi:MAG: hybrid sensor histidine kinase/response regulator, partial [Pseudomonadota bacterium]